MAERTKWAPGATALADAARAIAAIAFEGRSAEVALHGFGDARERSIIRAITLGSIRWFLRLAPAVEALLSQPDRLDKPIRALLVAAAHQIEYSRNAPQATVHAAVDATRSLNLGSASSLVNAVLRRFVAERTDVLSRLDRSLAVRTAHPPWLVERLTAAWPREFESILEANNEHPPLVLRVDLTRGDVLPYLKQLEAVGLKGSSIDWAPAAVRLDHPVPVNELPGFETGAVSVQDAGAQLAAKLLDARPHMRVLDACAAPGGKTGHLLEYTPTIGELTALDIDPERVSRIQDNLGRMGRTARLVVADLRELDGFWDGRPFDRVLVDAPCSSTGVIRRHPDIKLLRRPSDLAGFAATQEEILKAAFRVLAPGGRLVYSTCSVLPAENEEIVEKLLASDSAARPAAMPRAGQLAPGAHDRRIGMQLLPGAQAGSDGFYYACLEKTTVET